MSRPEVVWSPPEDARDVTRIGQFMDWLAETRGLQFDSYQALWSWSTTDVEDFWGLFAEWIGVRWRDQPEAVLAERTMPGASWFPGGTLNFAEHALAAAAERPDELAVIAHSQTRDPIELTWAEFAHAVASCRAGLRKLGVGPGDRVCAYVPNIPETLIAFLATASLGAVWSTCAPEFGTKAVIDRFLPDRTQGAVGG